MSSFENDRAFESVLQKTANIDKFVDEFFSFLARRTDFFVVSQDEEAKVGFPPGIAAKLVITKFKKWESFHAPPPYHQIEVTSSQESERKESQLTHPVTQTSNCNTESKQTEKVLNQSIPSGSGESKPVVAKPPKAEKKSEFGSYNGRKSDKYTWSQSINELDISVVVGKDVKTKKDVQVEITSTKVKVTVPSAEEPVLVDWTLSHPIIKDESYWSLHPGEAVYMSLQKVKERWWDHVFEGEEPLDRTKIDSVRPMEELDEEEQVKIQELVWNQEQKLKGLPTSDEMKMHDIMKTAWDAEGSPFKNQPFDPSLIQLVGNTANFPSSTPPS